jgi:hypothetical protein
MDGPLSFVGRFAPAARSQYAARCVLKQSEQ